MSEKGKTETLVGKVRVVLDALKTQEGRDALKDKLKEGPRRLRSAPGIACCLGVLVVVVLGMIILIRSCSSQSPAPMPNDSQQSNDSPLSVVKKDDVPKADKAKDSPAPVTKDSPQNVVKEDAVPKPVRKKASPKTLLGFTFGAKADEFKDVKIIERGGFSIYTTTQELRKKFRLFKSARLKFTSKDKRLYKIVIETDAKDLVGCNPLAVLREAQYCAAMIERKYGERFNLDSSVVLLSKEHSSLTKILGSERYGDYLSYFLADSSYYIVPHAFYHGFFNNTIEIKCSCTYFNDHYGIWISAMDHSIIAEDGGRTKDIPLDADDDEDNL